MKNLINALTKVTIDSTENPMLRFIIRKNISELKLKAFKKLSIQLYLHTPGKNIKCLSLEQNVNCSGIDKDDIWDLAEPYFFNEILRWIMSDDYKNVLREVSNETV